MKRLIIIIVALSISVSALAVCNWMSVIFNGTAGCTSESCGIGCHVYEWGANQWVCYTSMDQCCQCSWIPFKCHCAFGDGTGRNAVRYAMSGYSCSGDGQTCAEEPGGGN